MPYPSSSPSKSANGHPRSVQLELAFHSVRADGPSTPVPNWKLSEHPSFDNPAAKRSSRIGDASARPESGLYLPPVSARKLAASLWELQPIRLSSPAIATNSNLKSTGTQVASASVAPGCISREVSPCSHFQHRPSPASASYSSQAMMKCGYMECIYKVFSADFHFATSYAITWNVCFFLFWLLA
eukprot:c14660_g1_i2 orf=400-954(+)